MATTTDETTVEIQVDGQSSGPVSLSDIDAAARRLRVEQLSFDVGGRRPDSATVKVAGDMVLSCDLPKETQVRVIVSTEDGELLAEGHGFVASVLFKDEYEDGFVVGCQRVHAVKLG